jgi:hypothetical protein
MWPSIVFQPVQLAKSMIGARVWETVRPLDESERVDYAASAMVLGDGGRKVHRTIPVMEKKS